MLIAVSAVATLAGPQVSISAEDNSMTVGDAPDTEVVAFAKKVVVKGSVKGVTSIGGDVIVEGRIEGDVATVGGSIVQREGAYIGGKVIAFGGGYRPETPQPLRGAGSETVVFGMFEDELRSMAQNPSELLAPSFSLTFLAQRLLSVLFWFVLSIGLTTIAPGAVGRAVARLHLSAVRVLLIGTLAFGATIFGIAAAANLLPEYLSVSLGLMAFVLLLLSYVFGRVTLQVAFGKAIQKHLLAEGKRSETLAILIGVLVWTLLLSLPYVWTLSLVALFTAGLGLVLTARSSPAWHKS
ncbi:MAG: hypothetical protein ACK4S4_04865 [Pyrinomonadaceae bacterium]